jgi:hypothetical protein
MPALFFQKNQECMNEMIGPATKHYPLSDKKKAGKKLAFHSVNL